MKKRKQKKAVENEKMEKGTVVFALFIPLEQAVEYLNDRLDYPDDIYYLKEFAYGSEEGIHFESDADAKEVKEFIIPVKKEGDTEYTIHSFGEIFSNELFDLKMKIRPDRNTPFSEGIEMIYSLNRDAEIDYDIPEAEIELEMLFYEKLGLDFSVTDYQIKESKEMRQREYDFYHGK